MITCTQMIDDIIGRLRLAPGRISQEEFIRVLNTGYREVASRALCVERARAVELAAGACIISSPDEVALYVVAGSYLDPDNPVTYQFTDVGYEFAGDYEWADAGLGDGIFRRPLTRIKPEWLGWLPRAEVYPQYWFQWGDYIVVDPAPDRACPVLMYYSGAPRRALALDDDRPDDLPPELVGSVGDFALWVLSLKLRKFAQAVRYYNAYISNLARGRREYLERKRQERKDLQAPAIAGWEPLQRQPTNVN